MRFPLVRIFKKFQNYLAHADSSTGARTSEGIRMREIRDRAFFGSQENAHEPNNAPVKYIDILYIMVDLAHADSFTYACVA